MQHVDGSPTEKKEHLCGYEEQKLYPPSLSLRVIRTSNEVQEDLVTEVSVQGVNPSVKFSIFARARKYTNWLNNLSVNINMIIANEFLKFIDVINFD